jgi:hypothetical protein
MVNKATEAVTPKSSAPPPKHDLKTPHHFRNQLKKSNLTFFLNTYVPVTKLYSLWNRICLLFSNIP